MSRKVLYVLRYIKLVMNNRLNLSPLVKAIQSLQSALAQAKDEFVRDAVIQRFEYTYELC